MRICINRLFPNTTLILYKLLMSFYVIFERFSRYFLIFCVMDQERKSATDKVVRSKKIPCEATDTYINIQTVLVLNKMWYFVDL